MNTEQISIPHLQINFKCLNVTLKSSHSFSFEPIIFRSFSYSLCGIFFQEGILGILFLGTFNFITTEINQTTSFSTLFWTFSTFPFPYKIVARWLAGINKCWALNEQRDSYSFKSLRGIQKGKLFACKEGCSADHCCV